ncbi:MAG: hypothetical protein P4L61_02180 [Candidatus Pacebacteria bacterium]|nr:hypothetical protein [Candidatus Paceibacterota bacterium]
MKKAKVIFNMDAALKKKAMAKARKEGLTLSVLLNRAADAFVKNRLSLEIVDPDLAEGLDDIANGRVISQEDLFKRYGFSKPKRP